MSLPNKGHVVQIRTVPAAPSAHWRTWGYPGQHRFVGWSSVGRPNKRGDRSPSRMSFRDAKRFARDLKRDGHAVRILDPKGNVITP